MIKLVKKEHETYQHCEGARTHDLFINNKKYSSFVVNDLFGIKKVIGFHVDYPTKEEEENILKYAFKNLSDGRFHERQWYYIDFEIL